MDVGGGGGGTPGSTGKGRGRKAGGGAKAASGLGRGAGAKAAADISPGKPAAAPGSGPRAPAPAAGAGAAGGAGAAAGAAGGGVGPSSAVAAFLGVAGGVAKKRGRPPAKPKAAGDGADSGPEEAPDTSMPYRGTFTKELSRLMYGFGDYESPIQETINLVEDIVVEYVRETCCASLNEAMRIGKLDRGSKLKLDEKDILFLVRKDPKKYSRIRELLEMQQVIKDARKALDVDKMGTEADAGVAADAGGAPGGPAEEAGEELGDVQDEDIEVD